MRNKISNLILNKLDKEEENIKNQWSNPRDTDTRHFFIDDLLPSNVCLDIYNVFPKKIENFKNRNSFRERKKTLTDLSKVNKLLYDVSYAIQSPLIVKKLEKYLKLNELESDPSLYGSGLSVMFKKDYLNPHIDNSHDSQRKRYRRLNLLYYVSPNWQIKNGGNFELWDKKLKKPKIILSKFNRLVVMETNMNSWHSVNKVLVDTPRCCVSSYFFSKNSPNNKKYFHVTSFTGRKEQFLLRLFSPIDNNLRIIFSKIFSYGRGK